MNTTSPRSLIRKAIWICTILFTAALATSGQSDGYVTKSNLRGVVPAGTYQFSDIDNIN